MADSPQTCCSTCRTIFEVAPELLSSSDTRVRCGECLSIFDALANLRDPDDDSDPTQDLALGTVARSGAAAGGSTGASAGASAGASTGASAAAPAAALAGKGDAEAGRGGTDARQDALSDTASEDLDASIDHATADEAEVAELARLADETGTLDVTYSDFDLFSGDAQLPEVAYLDETSDTPEFDFDTVEIEQDETFSDTLFMRDATVDPLALASDPQTVAAEDGAARTPSKQDPEVHGAARRSARKSAAADADRLDEAAAGARGEARSHSREGKAPGSGSSGHARRRLPSVETDPDYLGDEDPVEPLVFQYRDREAGEQRNATAGAAAEVIAASGTRTAVVPTPAQASAAAAMSNRTSGKGSPVPSIDSRYEPPPRRTPWLLRSLLLLLLGGLLVGLFAYRERDTLHNRTLTRPVLLVACRVIGCEVPSRVDLASVQLLDRKVFSHPTRSDALVISLALRNTASFDQRYPVLVMRLRDRRGRTVVETEFAPADYLDDWVSGATLDANRRLDVSLEVEDPGAGAENYEFEFRKAES